MRSLVELVATRLPFIARTEMDWVPASSTSSVSPMRTFTESDCPARATTLASLAPPVRSRWSTSSTRLESLSWFMRVVLLRLLLEGGAADGACTVYGCDLSREYISINADYTT
mgnify:CR=1 FL=1